MKITKEEVYAVVNNARVEALASMSPSHCIADRVYQFLMRECPKEMFWIVCKESFPWHCAEKFGLGQIQKPVLHHGREDAEAEALRLSNKEGCRFFVLEAIGEAAPIKVQPVAQYKGY